MGVSYQLRAAFVSPPGLPHMVKEGDPVTRTVSRIRVLPTPESKPPYEDGTRPGPRGWHRGTAQPTGVQGTLALAFDLPSGAPATPHPPATLRLVEPSGRDAGHGDPTLVAVRPLACKLVQALVEVLAGVRPVTQLLHWTSPEVYDRVHRRAAVPGGWPPRSGPPAPVRVNSVRLSLPTDNATEVSAVVRGGERARALALRLEGAGRHWRCTDLELG